MPDGEQFRYISKVLRYWEYDLDLLYENNIYLLFPLKVFQVRKKITKLKAMNTFGKRYDSLIKEIKGDIFRVSKDILEHIKVIYKE